MLRCCRCGRRVSALEAPCPTGPGSHEHLRGAESEAADAGPAVRVAPLVPGYELGALLGRGGFGEVWEARPTAGGDAVAIKIARGDIAGAGARLAREGDILAALGGDHAPTLLGRARARAQDDEPGDGAAALILERVPAPSLAALLVDAGPLPAQVFARAATAVVAAVAAVHARGVVHGDLKPENLCLAGVAEDAAVRAWLLDFGSARQLATPTDAGAPADAGDHREPGDGGRGEGAAEYMAPEQTAGAEIDPSSDIYSAGVLLFEMLTGRPPFVGTAASLAHDHARRRPPSAARLVPCAPALEQVLRRCLAKRPTSRFADAAALADALADALRAESSSRPSERSSTPASGSPARAGSGPGARGEGAQRFVLLYLPASASAAALEDTLAAFDAHLVDSSAAAQVLAVPAQPGAIAGVAAAASSHVDGGLCARALVDLAELHLRRRPGGRVRLLAGALPEHDLEGAAFAGVRLSAAAAAAAAKEEDEGQGQATRATPDGARVASDAAESAPRMLGRERELDALVAAAQRCWHAQRPGLATVIAAAGFGKSVLADALSAALSDARSADDSDAPRARVLRLSPSAVDAQPYADLGQLVAKLLAALPADAGGAGADQPEALWRAQVGGAAEPRAEAAFAWLARGAAPEAAPASLSAAPGALELAAVRAVGRFALALAARAPLAIVCDDVHWAGGALLATLEYITRARASGALWVCALGRPSFADARPRWGERAGDGVHLELAALAPEAIAALTRALLPPACIVPAPAHEWLVARSQGVPLYLVELLRLIEREGLVRRHQQQGASRYLATEELDRLSGTPGARWLAERELAAMTPELAAHARLCALLGDSFAAAALAGVLDQLERAGQADELPLDAGAGLDALVALGLLREPAPGQMRFRHALLRDAVAESAAPGLRLAVHRAAAAYYRARCQARGGMAHSPIPGDGGDSGELYRLAEHAGEAGDADAGTVYLALAERARAQHAYVAAENLYSRALDHLSEDDRDARAHALHGRGRIRYRHDRHDDAADDLGRARSLVRALDADVGEPAGARELDIVLEAATARDWARDFAGSRALADEAHALAAAGAPTPVQQVQLDLARARSMWRDPEAWSRAPALLERVIERAAGLGDAAYEAHIIALLIAIDILPGQGLLERAAAAADQAIALARAHGDAVHLGVTLMNRRSIWFARGLPERVLEDAERYRALGDELGLVGWLYASAGNRADALYQCGRLREAWPAVREAVDWEEKLLGDHRDAALLHARMAAYEGDEAGARAMWQTLDPELLSPMGRSLYALVDVASRDGGDVEWDAVLERCARNATQCEPIEAAELRGLWCQRRGRAREAERWLRRAAALCDELPGVMGPRVRAALARVVAEA
ncbi:serine/threonine-protein kinase PknK [Haliangium ochraceum]|uniref:Serine/threonine protein kinase n=1 Tax=Haliangium ochraceum (strain DSM 14365 / JCM 11303 / SMP-2) TaxID=502025 RepID=D0LLZ9_HALO1|nr:serine/threonine-protein kinase [Haliangium ochraceum]ACY15177.1 serine/threonine protein kinase [Haliangium ochraceum DSM 14365]